MMNKQGKRYCNDNKSAVSKTPRGLPAPEILDLVDLGFSIIPIERERGGKRPPAAVSEQTRNP